MTPVKLLSEEIEALGELSQGEGIVALSRFMTRLVVDMERKALCQSDDHQIVLCTRQAQGARTFAAQVSEALETLRRGGTIRRK